MRAVAAILLLSVLTAFAFAEELELNADPAQCSACMRIAQKAYHGLGCGATQAEINAYCGTLADECGGLIATMCSGKCTEIGPCSRKNCCNGGWCNCGASHGGAATANAAANGMNTYVIPPYSSYSELNCFYLTFTNLCY